VTNTIQPHELKARLTSSDEIALVDVREQGVFAQEHLLLASSISLSHIETMLADRIPRLNTPIVVCDGGPIDKEGLARRAASKLHELGYTDVTILAGGVSSWRDAGLEVFSGVNVPSKAFGEFVERHYQTPHISAQELHQRQHNGDDLVVVDARPFTEYQRMCIPKGIDVPGAELVYRIHDIAPRPQTDIVVNCAGRTRSIIGTQSLINAGISNRVMALKNGTMGWQLSGYELESQADRVAAEPSNQGLLLAQQAAARVAKRSNIRHISHDKLAAWQDDRTRTLYLLDVRSPEEFEAGHLPGSRHAPGGQLVQATDEYVAVRGARVVLVDDQLVRAVMTASWLLQMGWPAVYVLDSPFDGDTLETGPHRPRILGFEEAETLSAYELKAALDSRESVAVMDLGNSLQYRRNHIAGAFWAVRSRLDADLTLMPPVGLLVLTSNDDVVAHLAAKDLTQTRPNQLVRVLAGGNHAWFDAGFPKASGMQQRIASSPDVNPDENDMWYKPYDYSEDSDRRMQQYLDWEIALVDKIERDGTLQFRCFE